MVASVQLYSNISNYHVRTAIGNAYGLRAVDHRGMRPPSDSMIHWYHLIFLFKDGPMTLTPSVDVQVPPVWPLACARRVKFLSILSLRCEYVPGGKEGTTRLVILYFMLIPFKSMSISFPGPLPTKSPTQHLPAAKFFRA